MAFSAALFKVIVVVPCRLCELSHLVLVGRYIMCQKVDSG
jgi:hypothetical protein